MKRGFALRKPRMIHVAVAAAALGIPGTAVAFAGSRAAGAGSAQAQRPLSVHARRRARNVLVGQRVAVLGGVSAANGRMRVRLQELAGGRWQTVARAWSGPRGGFRLSFRPATAGRHRLRVLLGGTHAMTASASAAAGKPAGRDRAAAGTLTVYHQSVASWYDDAGSTACGFHAHYGVANVTLPCGTRVSFHYNGRAVTAVVDDRGPFVAGREWDLNQNTAAALGFSGVQVVWSEP